MEPNEFITEVNEKAESLGLDYRLGDIIVSLKGNRGEILIATKFECSHTKGNFEKYNQSKHKVLEDIEKCVLKTCNHCKGKGLVYIDEQTAFSRLGMFNGYSYKNTAGNIKCKECNGAGKVKYIIQKVELLIKEGK